MKELNDLYYFTASTLSLTMLPLIPSWTKGILISSIIFCNPKLSQLLQEFHNKWQAPKNSIKPPSVTISDCYQQEHICHKLLFINIQSRMSRGGVISLQVYQTPPLFIIDSVLAGAQYYFPTLSEVCFYCWHLLPTGNVAAFNKLHRVLIRFVIYIALIDCWEFNFVFV